jgi:hypothetical protein
MLALLFTLGAVTHGFFPFPLLWIAVVALFLSRGRRRRRWSDEGNDPQQWRSSHRC